MKRKNLECVLTYDLLPEDGEPQPGEILVSRGAKGFGSAYLILNAKIMSARPGSARVWIRWRLKCHRISLEEGLCLGHRWTLFWYPRKRRADATAL